MPDAPSPGSAPVLRKIGLACVVCHDNPDEGAGLTESLTGNKMRTAAYRHNPKFHFTNGKPAVVAAHCTSAATNPIQKSRARNLHVGRVDTD